MTEITNVHNKPESDNKVFDVQLSFELFKEEPNKINYKASYERLRTWLLELHPHCDTCGYGYKDTCLVIPCTGICWRYSEKVLLELIEYVSTNKNDKESMET